MRARLEGWLGLAPEDGGVVAPLLLPFATSAAAATLVASATKASFLAAHPISRLPWVLGAQAIWAIVSGLAFARLAERASLARRATASLAGAALVLVALRALYEGWAAEVSFAAVLLGPAVVQLAVSQLWATPGLLPPRQAKRLLPVLATVATAGASGGGLAAGGLARLLDARDLLVGSAALLAATAILLRAPLRELAESSSATGIGRRARTAGAGLGEVARLPLVARLAVVVALVQAGSVILEVQLGGELRRAFDERALASFLGIFYAATNAASLLVGLGATSRMVKAFGLGLCVACTAVAHLAGSLAYVALALTGAAPVLVALAAAAAGERLGQYTVARAALAMALGPLEDRRQAVARTLVETVGHRGATLLASAALLGVGDTPLHAVAPWTIAAAALALATSLGVGASYRRALYEALRAGPIDEAGYRRIVVDDAVVEDVTRALAGSDAMETRKGLEIVRALAIPVPDEVLERLARSGDPGLAARALDAWEALGREVPDRVASHLLSPDAAPELLRAALAALPREASPELRALAAALVDHPDACVARLARAASTRARGGSEVGRTQRPLRSLLGHADAETRRVAVEALGQARVGGGERDLVRALSDAELRGPAVHALVRFGDRMAPEARRALAEGSLGSEAAVALVTALERAGGAACREVLQLGAAGPDRRVRDAAIDALFRLGRRPDARPRTAWLRARAEAEVAEVSALGRVDAPAMEGDRVALCVREIAARRQRAERRAILLCAMLFARRPLHRAATQAHAASARARSTALELLEQHVREPSLRVLVELIEAPPGPRVPGDERALADDAWLTRLSAWGRGEPDDGLDGAARLSRVPLLASLGAEVLEPLARVTTTRKLGPGEVLARRGEVPDALFVVLAGTLRVDVPGAPPLGPGDCVGGLGLLARAARTADVTAETAAAVTALDRTAFEAHLAEHPTFARELLRIVARRYRALSEEGPS